MVSSNIMELIKEKDKLIEIIGKDIALKIFTFASTLQDTNLLVCYILLVSNTYESLMKWHMKNRETLSPEVFKDTLKTSFKIVLETLYELGIGDNINDKTIDSERKERT